MNFLRRLLAGFQVFVSLVFLAGGLVFVFVFYRFSAGGDTTGFALAGILGSGLFLVGVFSLRSAVRLRAGMIELEQRRKKFPDQPWLWRKDWAGGEIRASESSAAKGIWIIALFWNGLLGSVLFLAWDQISASPLLHAPVIITVMLQLAGVFLLVLAIRKTLHFRKFGMSILRLSSVPAQLGGAVVGSLHCPDAVAAASAMTLTLCCTRQDNNSESPTSTILFQRETRIERGAFSRQGSGVIVPVELPLPVDGAESDTVDACTDTIHWEIHVHAALPGIDFSAAFEVPVYGRSPTPFVPSRPTARAPSPAARTHGARIRSTQTGGIEIMFPATRDIKGLAGLALFIVFWLSWMLLFTRDEPPRWFQFIWAGIAILMFVTLLRLSFGYALIRIERGQLSAISGALGLSRSKHIATAEIHKIHLDSGLQIMGHAYHLLQVETASGKRISIGTRVRDRNEADWIISKIEDALKKSLR